MNNMNINTSENKNNTFDSVSTYRGSYIVTSVLFGIVFLICLFVFGVVAFNAYKDLQVTLAVAGVALNITRAVSYVAAIISAFIVCVNCAKANKIKNPDIYIPPRDTFYYIKRMGFITIMIVLMSLAASLIGMCAVALFGSVLLRFGNAFIRELVIKLPLFILYLSFVYKMLIRYGFMDSQRKIFNINLRILGIIIAFMLMLPGTVYDSFFYVPAANEGSTNVQTVLSQNSGVYKIDESDGFAELNENFNAGNVIFIFVMILLTFAIQLAVFGFAYKRGKQIMIKEHIREINEYEMNENI